jgi:hypothetical protein
MLAAPFGGPAAGRRFVADRGPAAKVPASLKRVLREHHFSGPGRGYSSK